MIRGRISTYMAAMLMADALTVSVRTPGKPAEPAPAGAPPGLSRQQRRKQARLDAKAARAKGRR